MAKVKACEVPQGSLLAEFGGPQDYRDCFERIVPGGVSLPEFIERFYRSTAFRPERIVLGLLGRGASDADVRALARGEADRVMVWKVVERHPSEILLESKGTGTASWFAVEPRSSSSEAVGRIITPSSSGVGDGPQGQPVGQKKTQTRLLFGSWVGNLEQSGWRSTLRAHVWYSKVLLGGLATKRR